LIVIRKAWRRVIKVAKLQGIITPHTMRHTMATNAAHAGVDGATLQALGGWKSRRMTERYTHPGQMRDAMDKLASIYAAGRQTTKKPRARSTKAA
jgi:integrase